MEKIEVFNKNINILGGTYKVTIPVFVQDHVVLKEFSFTKDEYEGNQDLLKAVCVLCRLWQYTRKEYNKEWGYDKVSEEERKGNYIFLPIIDDLKAGPWIDEVKEKGVFTDEEIKIIYVNLLEEIPTIESSKQSGINYFTWALGIKDEEELLQLRKKYGFFYKELSNGVKFPLASGVDIKYITPEETANVLVMKEK